MDQMLKLPEEFRRTGAEGLTEAEAAGRKGNAMPQDDGKSTLEIVLRNTLTLFNGLNLLLGLCLALVGSWRNMLFLLVVISNTGIAIIQELKARNTIRKLKLLHAPKARVIREGTEKKIAPEKVAEGDLMVLRSGDQAVADGMVIGGAGRAMESLLTGESDAVPKQEGDWIYSGSYVTEGKIICQAVYVGEESYAGRLTKSARKEKKAESGLMKELKKLIRWDSYALLPLGALLLMKQVLLQHMPLETAMPGVVAAMLGMIPEGLMLLASVAMAVGVIRLGKKQVLVQELYGIEGLARVDILCLDKTGTLTSGRMQTDRIETVDAGEEEARKALSRFLGAFDDPSPTLEALRGAVAPGTESPTAVQPFSSRRKKSAASFDDGKTLILGAPEFVMGSAYPETLRGRVDAMTAEGRRVLILAEAEGTIEGETLPEVTRVLALCSLKDEMRTGAEDTVRYFREEGVTLKVISGDAPATVARAARAAGIEGWENAVDARGLTGEAQILEACEKYTIFGRVTPDQKKEIVEALKKAGHTVAMTGDGVNDIPALRAADCSIAMAEGADAAKHAAQLTLLESDFSSVPQIVLEGRRVINNITRSASLFLTKTIFSFLLSLLTLVRPGAYPFQPIQMTLVSACTIGVPGFFLALQPSRERIRGKFLENVLRKALPGGVSVALCATAAMLMGRFGWTTETCSTLATWIAGIMGVVVLCRTCWPPDLMRSAIMLISAASFTMAATLGKDVFFLTRLQGAEWAALAALAALGGGLYWLTAVLEKRQRAAEGKD